MSSNGTLPFCNRRGPNKEIRAAPTGAVIMIDKTAIVSTVVPRPSRYGSPIAKSNAIPPIAAYEYK